MSGLLRTIVNRTAPSLRGHTVSQRANLYTSPAKEKLSPFETAFGIGTICMAILAPPAWILAHLEDYKKKD